MEYIELGSGEYCTMSGIEITSIPDFSILLEEGKRDRPEDLIRYLAKHKKEYSTLLAEIYQVSKRHFHTLDYKQDASIEFLWCATPAENQIFKAKIKLCIIVRAIGRTKADAEERVAAIRDICADTLRKQRYGYRPLDGEVAAQYQALKDRQLRAIVKEDRQENIQSQYINQCYSFGKFPETESDLSSLVSELSDSPGSAVSFQLIPTYYGDEELGFLGRYATVLDTLFKGTQDQAVGNVTNPLAQKHSELYSYYINNHSVLYHFNLLLYAPPAEMPRLAAKVFGQINGNTRERMVNLREVPLDGRDIDLMGNLCILPWALNEVVSEKHLYSHPVNLSGSEAVRRISNVITCFEASELARLPIGSKDLSAGFTVNFAKQDISAYRKNVVNTGDIVVGSIKKSNGRDKIGFSLTDLTKHMLVVGTPGSGKTTFSVSLLDRLWKERGIPFLVIEPAKNEYRALIDSIPDIQIFTPGKDEVSPYVVNPFVPPKKVRLKSYKSVLKTAFAAGVTMTSPLDKIFEETVNNTYSDFGWLDSFTTDSGADIFNISDFIKNFTETFEALGYVGEAQNIGRAGLVRLGSLVNLFDNYHSVPMEDLLSRPTIIELAAIENSDQKALMIALLLLNILSYVNANFLGEGKLRNVVLLEEAHVLLDSNDSKGEGEANPAAIAKVLLKRMLAEIRSYGVGIVIADQSPEKVTSDIIKLTNIKLGFNLVEKTDKEILANSTNMPQVQQDRLTKLGPGEAFLFMNGLDEPEEVVTEDYRAQNAIRITISDDEVAEKSTYWRDKQEKLRPYPVCAYCKSCRGGCDNDTRNLGREAARRIFSKNLGPDAKDSRPVKALFRQMRELIAQALKGKVPDERLFGCTELHLMRRIKYDTKIKISDATFLATLSNIGGRQNGRL
ncbi:MAG: ATP-binding protein [Firmicutes bacterium]|nr:ATP-binding protein [Bacillota bacterium]